MMKNPQPHHSILETLNGGEPSLLLTLLFTLSSIGAARTGHVILWGLFVALGVFLFYRKLKRLPAQNDSMKLYYWIQIAGIAAIAAGAVIWYFLH